MTEQPQRKVTPVMRTTIRVGDVEIETNNVEDLRAIMADLGLAHQRRRVAALPGREVPIGNALAESLGVSNRAKVHVPDDMINALVDHIDDEDPAPAPLATVHHIERETVLVPLSMYDALEVILQFPEGISTNGVCTLLGLTRGQVGNRIQRLKYMRLVEKVKGHKMWVATRVAREAKLVAS